MFQKIGHFLLLGTIWLFLFSIPVGYKKNLFAVGHHYIVDTRPVHWIIAQIENLSQNTVSFVKTSTDKIVRGTIDSPPPVSHPPRPEKKNLKEKFATNDTQTVL